MIMPRKPRKKCLFCGKETLRVECKYCSNACQIEYQHESYIKRWKEGKESGLQSIGLVSKYVKKYLRKSVVCVDGQRLTLKPNRFH